MRCYRQNLHDVPCCRCKTSGFKTNTVNSQLFLTSTKGWISTHKDPHEKVPFQTSKGYYYYYSIYLNPTGNQWISLIVAAQLPIAGQEMPRGDPEAWLDFAEFQWSQQGTPVETDPLGDAGSSLEEAWDFMDQTCSKMIKQGLPSVKRT